jgi:hypothetical protein
MNEADRIARIIADSMRDRLREMTIRELVGVTEVTPARSLTLDDFLEAKRLVDAIAPPPMYAVKLHPADEPLFRQAAHPPLNKTIFGPFGGVPVFWDVRMPRGRAAIARDRATYHAWLREEWRNHLLSVLRRRMHALMERGGL